MQRNLYTYTYVEQPFDEIAQLLAEDPGSILQSATDSAAIHANEVRAHLQVRLGRYEVGRDVTIHVGAFDPRGIRAVSIPISWESSEAPALFPSMEAALEVSSLSLKPPLTQVSLIATYEPPLGLVGAAGDALVGHRIAEATVHRFLHEVAERIDREVARRSVATPALVE